MHNILDLSIMKAVAVVQMAVLASVDNRSIAAAQTCESCQNIRGKWKKKRSLNLHYFQQLLSLDMPHPVSSVLRLSDSWPGGCELKIRLRWTFIPAYFRLSPLLKACVKSSWWLWKESSFRTGIRKPGNTCHPTIFPSSLNKYSFRRINNRQRLKTFWEKKKLPVTSNVFFSHNVFCSIR